MTVQAVLEEIRKRPGTGDVIPIIDPATEEQITEFTDCGPEAINDAVARAKETAESGVWSGLPDYDRAKVLWRVADLMIRTPRSSPNSNRSTRASRRLKHRSSPRLDPSGSATTPAGARRSTASRAT